MPRLDDKLSLSLRTPQQLQSSEAPTGSTDKLAIFQKRKAPKRFL